MLESIKHLGVILKKKRLQEGLSQRALSAKTGIPQNHLSKIENGEVNLQASTLIEISRTLSLELMLVPRELIPTFQAILKGRIPKDSEEQIPMYQLDQMEEEND